MRDSEWLRTIREMPEKIRGCRKHGTGDQIMDRTDGLLRAMLDMGEAMVGSGAEIYRAEDTLRRLAGAYGAEDCEVFIITSSIVISLRMKGEPPKTQTRRIRRSVDNNFTKLEDLNELSRDVSRESIPVEELLKKIDETAGKTARRRKLLAGDVIAAAAFAVFFRGSVQDGIAAGMMGIVIWLMQVYLAPICMNPVVFEFIGSFLSGFLICLVCRICPFLHMDQIMIGDIMLLIPGIPFTNSIRDILLGDTLSGIVRFVEALLLAIVLTLGFLAAIFLAGRAF